MSYEVINFRKKFALFDEQWQPRVIAEMNDYQFKIVKLQGDFIWHDHKNTDETFIVLEGDLRIDFRDGAVHLSAGEMFVVRKGVEHKPYAEHEVKLLLIEPHGVLIRDTKAASAQPRMTFGFDPIPMSAFGTKQTSPRAQSMPAFEGIAGRRLHFAKCPFLTQSGLV